MHCTPANNTTQLTQPPIAQAQADSAQPLLRVLIIMYNVLCEVGTPLFLTFPYHFCPSVSGAISSLGPSLRPLHL